MAGGIGFIPLDAIQAVQKLKQILNSYRQHTELKKMFHVTFQWAQKVAGVSQGLFQQTHRELPVLQQEKWIVTLQSFLHNSSLQLHLPNITVPQLKRQRDQVIMDVISQYSHISNDCTTYVNRCRLYLHAETMADLTNAAGTHLLSASYFCMEEGRPLALSTQARSKTP